MAGWSIATQEIAAAVTHWRAVWERHDAGVTRVWPRYWVAPPAAELTLSTAGQPLSTVCDRAVLGALAPQLDARAAGYDAPLVLGAVNPADRVGSGMHLLPLLFGARIGQNGAHASSFTTWSEPLLPGAEAARMLKPTAEAAPALLAEITAAYEGIPRAARDRFPVALLTGSPLDTAAELLGSTNFYLGFHTQPDDMRYLLDLCADAVVDLWRLGREHCPSWCGGYGMPGIYVNDLVTEFLSPAHWQEFVLPCYRRLAAACGAVGFAVNSPDPHVLQAAAAMDELLGCTVHHAVAAATIRRTLAGRATLMLDSYSYSDEFDRPTLHAGEYLNPIVAAHSRDYRELAAALAGKVNLVVCVHRANRDRALADTAGLPTDHTDLHRCRT